MNKVRMVLLAITSFCALALFGACNSGTSGPAKEDVSGAASMALSDGSGNCVTGDIVIEGTLLSGGDVTYTLDEGLSGCETTAPITVPLRPGTYQLTISDLVCNPAGEPDTDYVGCVLNPSPVEFTITAAQKTGVTLAFTFNYLNRDEEVVFSVGEADISIGAITIVELCGPDVARAAACTANEVCYIVDSETDAPYCFTTCESTSATPSSAGCGSNQFCTPVLLENQIGEIGSIDSPGTPHVCMSDSGAPPAPSGSAGSAGSAGAGGAV